ncbi:MAG: hypothetical protein ACLP9C_12220 [Acidimicrobiales bacterium]
MAQVQGQHATPADQGPQRTGWVGWIAFAAIMMMIGGALDIFYGLVAVIDNHWVGWYHTTHVDLSISAWGWVQIIIGAIVLLAGFGVLTGSVLARTIGVIVAGLSLIANFFLIPVYPFWAVIIIVVDALVIWALTVHGGELRERGGY